VPNMPPKPATAQARAMRFPSGFMRFFSASRISTSVRSPRISSVRPKTISGPTRNDARDQVLISGTPSCASLSRSKIVGQEITTPAKMQASPHRRVLRSGFIGISCTASNDLWKDQYLSNLAWGDQIFRSIIQVIEPDYAPYSLQCADFSVFITVTLPPQAGFTLLRVIAPVKIS